jgi:hypothetical protein
MTNGPVEFPGGEITILIACNKSAGELEEIWRAWEAGELEGLLMRRQKAKSIQARIPRTGKERSWRTNR